MAHDPWDHEPPSAFDDDDDADKEWDPDELLARAIQRGRHAGGSHLLGSWLGFYHGLRAGDGGLRAEGERALKAEAFMTKALAQARLIREGKA